MKKTIVLSILYLAIFNFSISLQASETKSLEQSSNEILLSKLTATAEEQDQQNFSGAIAISKDGKEVFLSASGMSNRELKIDNTPDTRFSLASTAKLFTAIALMQLVEAGEIELDAPVGRYIPSYRNEVIRNQATVRHLLKMQSGLGDIFDYGADFSTFRSHSDYVELFEETPPTFTPGTDGAYSNAGYILLGRIIEIVSGEDFYSYVDRNIFEAANMTSTSYSYQPDNSNFTAIPYRVSGIDGIAESLSEFKSGELIPDLESLRTRGTSAGGAYSTVKDFVKFDKALRNETLINNESIAVIIGKAFIEGERGAGIAGGAPGVSTRYKLMPNGYSVVVFGNLDFPIAYQVADEFVKHLE